MLAERIARPDDQEVIRNVDAAIEQDYRDNI